MAEESATMLFKLPRIMKKLLIFSFLLISTYSIASAQSKKYTKPDAKYININAGIGVLPTFLKDAGKAKILPMSISADYKLAKSFSVGAYFGYSSTETGMVELNDGSTAQWTNNYKVAGVRLVAQSRSRDGWNVYGGMTVGYGHSDIDMMVGEISKLKDNRGVRPQSGKMLMTGFIGGRYSFTDHVGIFSEVGLGGVSLATAGLSIRI